MEFTGERYIPGTAGSEELGIEHFTRYRFASQFASGKRVLDAACGSGYGSRLLSETAKTVYGIDISAESVAYANENYPAENLTFTQASVAKLPFEDGCFDLIVSFETLEHVDAETQRLFLSEIRRTLAPDGILVMSTPNREIYDKRGDNEFHVHELSLPEYRTFLNSAFQNVRFFNQQWEISNGILSPQSKRAQIAGGEPLETAEYLIAVCCDAAIEEIDARVFVREDGEYARLMAWAMDNHNRNERSVQQIAELTERNERLTRENLNQSGHIEQLIESERKLSESVAAQQGTIRNQAAHIEQLIESERKLSESVAAQQGTIQNQAAHIEQLIENERRLSAKSVAQQAALHDQAAHIEQLTGSGERQKQQLLEIGEKLRDCERGLSEKDAWIAERDSQILYLSGSRQELEQIKASRSWRFLGYAWKVRDVLVPKGSRRRLCGKLAVKLVKHPVRFLSLCTPRQIGKFLQTAHSGGAEAASRMLDEDLSMRERIKAYAPLAIPNRASPLVSIVIPVYNQFDYTYGCIRSIIENSGDVAYEVILADDCSTDLTRVIRKAVSGLRVVRNRKNLRFLRNCNHAAQKARGKYILFLNNDTEVQKYWLTNLVDLIESADDVGMVGSKLISADGTLQEAGGIIWKDGTGWNYGRGGDPNAPEYNYVKEVDYISGAAIMIRRSLWREIGGFDERFAPAYCEDSDLAFEVRKHGYRVMYQPLSIVVHFEGISNGTDLSAGQKAYQIENQKKLYEKWKDVLETEHFDNGTHVFLARDRSREKKHILFIDHYVPTYDKDAGSRTVYQYIRLLCKMGYHIYFIGDNFYPMQPYTCVLQQLGVEVLYGVYYQSNWKTWL